MSVKANYFKVGLFVIVATALLIGAVIFWGASALRQKKFLVETYMNESVKGLTKGSQVYYQGIQVGSVDSIVTAPIVYGVKPGSQYGRYIVVRIALTHEQITTKQDPREFIKDLVKEGICLQMKSSPLTGVAYLEASGFENRKNPAEWTAWQPQYPYIPSVPSLMSTLADSAEVFFKKLAELDVKAIVDNGNTLLVDLDQSVKDLQIAALKTDMQKLIGNATSLIAGVDKSVQELNIAELRQEIQKLIGNTDAAIVQMRSLIRSTDQAKSSANLEEILSQLTEALRQVNLMINYEYPNFNLVIQEVMDASKNLKEGTAELKQQPSKLLFGQPPAKSEIVK